MVHHRLPQWGPGRLHDVLVVGADDLTLAGPRTVYVGADRIERWITGFGERNPGLSVARHTDRAELIAPDGSRAVQYPTFAPALLGDHANSGDSPSASAPGGTPANSGWTQSPSAANLDDLAAALIAEAYSVRVIRALLIRRGGYACAVLTGDVITASKVGSRYVQGRTAAGGWSQQRFARRREGQVQVLVGATIDVATRILLPAAPNDALVTGGDKPLVEQVLAAPQLKPLTRLIHPRHLDVPDPKQAQITLLREQARAIRIVLHPPPPG
jgi:hypothetical protein